jgi:protein ImuB
VFSPRRPVHVTDEHGEPVTVDERGGLSASPSAFSPDGIARLGLAAWAGPWQLDERWWSPDTARRVHRFQAVDDTGCAWLLALDASGWWAEARYD